MTKRISIALLLGIFVFIIFLTFWTQPNVKRKLSKRGGGGEAASSRIPGKQSAIFHHSGHNENNE